MDKSVRLQLQTFFEQFTKLSERAEKHWPLPEPDGNNLEERIPYQFIYIKTKEDLATLKDDFIKGFEKLNKSKYQFSPRLFLVDDIKNQLSTQKDYNLLFKSQPSKANISAAKHVPVYTFLVLAYQTTDNSIEVNGALVLNYFTDSKSILIKSILVNSELTYKDQQDLVESMLSYKYKQKADSDSEDFNEIVIKYGGLAEFIRSELNKNRTKNILTGIYHEVNDPTADNEDVFKTRNSREKAADILDIFHYINAKHIRFSYRKPIYGFKKDIFLLTFPELLPNNTNPLMVDIRRVMGFIINYAYTLPLASSYLSYNDDIKIIKNESSYLSKNNPLKFNANLKGFEINKDNIILLNAESLIKHRNSEYSNELYLNNIPRIERPNFSYKRAAVCFEIVIDEDYFDPIGIRYEDDVTPVSKTQFSWFGKVVNTIKEEWKLGEDPKPIPLNCVIYHSTETDLFAYKYQGAPPYFTKYFNLTFGNDVTIHLPSHFEFTSEGRQETYYVLPKSGKEERNENNNYNIFYRDLLMEVHLSYTYFLNSNVRIWHLVLTPIEQKDKVKITSNVEQNKGISELDIIKLMKFFSGSQENESEDKKREVLENITFSHNNELNKTSPKIPSRKKLLLIEILHLISSSWYLIGYLLRLPLVIIRKPYYLLKHLYKASLYKNPFPILYFQKFIRNLSLSFTSWSYIVIIVLLSTFYKPILVLLVLVIPDKPENTLNFLKKTALYIRWKHFTAKFNYIVFNQDAEYKLINVSKITLTKKKTKNLSLIDLLQSLTGIDYIFREDRKNDTLLKSEDRVLSLRNIRSGIVEIDTGAFDEVEEDNLLSFNAESFKKFYDRNLGDLQKYNNGKTQKKPNNFQEEPNADALHENLVKKQIRNEVKKSYLKLYNKEKEDTVSGALLGSDDDDNLPEALKEYANYVFKAYCGICLGIFDYDRMGLEEIDDTLMPLEESKTEQSFQALNRGVLSMFGYEEDVMNTFWKTLGLSPYLIIPSAVLAQNDSVSLDAERRLDSLLANLREEKSSLSVSELISNRHEIDDLLNDDILSNVFHYKTEKGIYKQGMESRGIDERIKTAQEKLGQLDKEIELKQEEKNSRYQKRTQALLAVLGLINFYTVIRDFFVDELAYPSDKAEKNINLNNVIIDEWLKNVVNGYFPTLLKNRLEMLWHSIKEATVINSLGLSHLTFIILIISAIIWFFVTRIFDPSKSGKSKSWQNRKRQHRKLPKVHVPGD